MNEDSPMIIQYRSIKSQYKDSVLFFRLGDFYEMFDEDAKEISALLNLTLTQRTGHPMCGIPYHASRIYIARLLRAGKKIAICEQLTIPGPGKGLAERKVVEVITPGTAIEEDYLEQNSNNYLAAFCGNQISGFGFAYIDVTTGEFLGTVFSSDCVAENFRKELGRIQPTELLIQKSLLQDENSEIAKILTDYPSLVVNPFPDWTFETEKNRKTLLSQFGTASLHAFGIEEYPQLICAAGVLVEYVTEVAHKGVSHVEQIKYYGDDEFVIIDDASRKNLELLSNLRDGSASFTLFESLNATKTSMGSRLLRSWIVHPLRDIQKLQNRLDKVKILAKKQNLLEKLRDSLSTILDIQRLAGRVAMEKAHAKDLIALKTSLLGFNITKNVLNEIENNWLIISEEESKIINDIADTIDRGIKDEPSILLSDGNIIKDNWSRELDDLHKIQTDSNEVLNSYLEEEKEKSGIHNLKIRYNKIIGFFLEVSKGNLNLVPDYFIRRQSLVNGDRFTTNQLVELETKINSAAQKVVELEKQLFLEIRQKIQVHIPLLMKIANEISVIDVFQSFAYQANVKHWVCPELRENDAIEIRGGRHPVVEDHLPSGEFIPNDLALSHDDKFFAMITGPNMAGKSTFLRQTALIVLMSQIGSFVPADIAVLSPIDKLFCRVGASDNLARGESTFLLEMNETAHILRTATNKSLVIMDEVGRGTSTQDGLSLAWAISEYLLRNVQSKTLFATHYHELSQLKSPNLIDLYLQVLEENGSIVFLKKVIEGSSSSSYGIHVAKLAGIPSSVIKRATQLLQTFGVVSNGEQIVIQPPVENTKKESVELFSKEELVLDEILGLSPDSITPMQALQFISRWNTELSGKKNK